MADRVYILIFAMAFIGCNPSSEVVVLSHQPIFDTTAKSNAETDFEKIFILGSDAGFYFQTLHKLNKYDEMLQMTAKESLEYHGIDVVNDFYKNDLEFAFELGKLQTVVDNKNGSKILIYESVIMATRRKTMIEITWENEMIKIVLPECLECFPVVK